MKKSREELAFLAAAICMRYCMSDEVFNVIYPIVSTRKGETSIKSLALAVGWLLYRSGWRPCAHIQRAFTVCRDEIRDSNNFGGSRIKRQVFPLLVDVVHRGYINLSDPVDRAVSEYVLNLENLDLICQILDVSPGECRRRWIKNEAVRLADVEFKRELKKGKFNYSCGKNSWSSRVYHPLTSMRGALRDHVFLVAGYRHQYDIKSCFPSLLAQVAGSYGPVYAVPAMSRAMSEPDRFRELVALSCGLLTPAGEPDVSAVKAILSALLFGARLQRAGADVLTMWGRWRTVDQPAIYRACGGVPALYDRVVECPLLRAYALDVARLTKLLRGKVREKYWDTLGAVPDWMGDRCWLYWFAEMLEQQVRHQMCEYVRSNRGRVFELHDCVITDVLVDMDLMTDYVRSKTGFDVRITHDIYRAD